MKFLFIAGCLISSLLLAEWEEVSTKDAPEPRAMFSSVFTGKSILIWSGCMFGTLRSAYIACSDPLPTGGIYDVATGTWKAMSRTDQPTPRYGHHAFWMGKKMIVWGGRVSGGPISDGKIYDLATDKWEPMAPAPLAPRYDSMAVWTGKEMVVWGGQQDKSGAAYDPSTDTWRKISIVNAASLRFLGSAVWTGKEMLIWGGFKLEEPDTEKSTGSIAVWGHGATLGTGARYNPETNTWTPITLKNAPAGRGFHQTVWTGTRMIVWGGFNFQYGPKPGQWSKDWLTDGGIYDPETDSWEPLSSTNAPSPRLQASSVWTGTEMIVWGGVFEDEDPPILRNDGGRYDLSTGKWTKLPDTSLAPRYGQCGHWTKSSVVFWGGVNKLWTGGVTAGYTTNTGAIYTP